MSLEAGKRQIETPVALLVFNRPETTRAVFARVAQARPRQLLLVGDGPRPDRAGERERCDEVRRIVSQVDWPCQVQTNFAAGNLGCRKRVISGLNWVFEQVEEAIILEDDILPDPSFFPYCEAMLERYRNEPRIAMVTGFNIGADLLRAPHSYYFSELTHIWGWATWRRAWRDYDERMRCWPAVEASGLLRSVFSQESAVRYWTPILEGMYRGTGPNTWDYQWMFTNLVHGRLAVAPQVNLVTNIGFGADATHTGGAKGPEVGVGSLEFPLRHPPAMLPWREMDALDQRLSEWYVPDLPTRARRKLRRIVRRKIAGTA